MDIPKSKFNSFLYGKVFIITAVVFTVFVTLVVYTQMHKAEQRSFELKLDNTINNYSSLFSLKINSYLNELNSILRFYNSTDNVSSEEFATFVAPILDQANDIQALEWIPRISHKKLNQHQKEFRNKRNEYSVWQYDMNLKKQAVTKRDYYYPVMFVYPYVKNKLVLGFDLGTNQKRRQALNKARDSGNPVATESITLVQNQNEESAQNAFLIFIPFYKDGNNKVSSEKVEQWTVSQRRENLAGFILGVFKISSMFESAIEFIPSSGLDIFIFDITDEVNHKFLYKHRSRMSTDTDEQQKIKLKKKNLNEPTTREFRIAGRQWRLNFVPTIHYYDNFQHNSAVIVLSVGMFMSLILLLYLMTLRYRMRAIKTQFEQYNNELINNEIKQRSVIETIAEALIVIDEKGTIEAFNPAATKLFGYEFEEITGKNVKTLMPNDIKKEHDGYLKSFVETGVKHIIGSPNEVVGLHKNGNTFQLELSVKDMVIQGELKFTGVMHDITKQKDYENEILIAKDLAEAGIESKNNFLATMSHEIRTPMNGVLGMIQILKDTRLSNEQREYVDVISNSGKALLGIINDILDFSKIEAGQLKIDPVVFDFEQVVFDVIRLLVNKEHQKKIQFIFNYSPECPKFVIGDPDRIRQVLMNLVGNAAKFTEHGHICIQVKQVRKLNSKYILRIDVQDTGVGIPQKAITKLFDSFTQADSSTTRKYGGTGLGLAICKQLVNLMAGDIGVTSEFNQGSTFWFTVTVDESDKNESIELEIFENKKMLIVDSYDFSRRQLEVQLSGFGITVTSVSSCHEAITELLKCNSENTDQSKPYDGLITDYKIGSTTALDFIEQIRSHNNLEDLDIILLSSVFRIGNTEKYTNAGVRAYLSKPVLNSVLHQALLEVENNFFQKHDSIITQHSLQEDDNTTGVNTIQMSGSVLIVEDNDVNTLVVKALLDKMGISNSSAVNGEQGIAKWQAADFDLILMDCQMPVMDGYQATTEIRNIEKQQSKTAIPIIALTANVMADDRGKCLAAGMDDFLAKPIENDALILILQKWLLPKENAIPDTQSVKMDISDKEIKIGHTQQSIIDMQKIQQLTDLMGEAMVALVNSYVTSSEDKISQLQQAFDSRDSSEVYQLAHGLKGASGNLGANQVMELSDKIEQLAKQGQLNTIGGIIDELLLSFSKTRQELNKIIEK
ncbi:MAG: CHASE domain-containing protein [Gammaproteobacteria bacterium]